MTSNVVSFSPPHCGEAGDCERSAVEPVGVEKIGSGSLTPAPLPSRITSTPNPSPQGGGGFEFAALSSVQEQKVQYSPVFPQQEHRHE